LVDFVKIVILILFLQEIFDRSTYPTRLELSLHSLQYPLGVCTRVDLVVLLSCDCLLIMSFCTNIWR